MAGGQGGATVSPTSALHAGLHDALPQMAQTFRDPWWIIGSAAMVLAGIPDVVPQDIDVLCSRRDALQLREAWVDHVDTAYRPADETRFRSAFARFVHLPMPVEVMGGLELMTATGWQPVQVHDDVRLDIAGYGVRLPTPAEQRRILLAFGRDKDLAKATRIPVLPEHPHVA
ncbi:hypothetical protein ASD72_12650 [Pseudoxanthomonas sp. Root630]|nr:hypothetical protein ASD72_12650 [Pseudoxanthomonas sp. Root630]